MRGLGRIYKRGPIFWIGYYHNGQQRRESSYSEKESDAKALLKKRLGEIGRGKLIGPSAEKVTFEELATDFLTDYQINDKRSMRSAKLSVTHLREFFGMDRAPQITTARVKKYIATRQEEGAANASINRELSALGRMFSLALESEKLVVRPYLPRLEENNARQGFVDHGNFLSVVNHLPEYLKDPMWFLYLSGWRVGEMRTLEWRDVDMAGKVIRLRPEVSKNKKPRLLSLSGRLLQILERAQESRRLDCRHVFHDGEQPVGDFRKSWHNACVAAGMGRLEGPDDGPKRYVGLIVHDLRRSAVRNMVRAGIREKTAMERSGHKTRNIFDRYDISSEKDQAEASDKYDSYIDQQPDTAKVVRAQNAHS